jgi:integrase
VRHRLAERVTAELLDATGVHLTPHQFRHLLARYYLDRNPTGHEVVRRFLGHSSIKSTVDYYASQDRVAANRLFTPSWTVSVPRGAAAPPAGRPRRREG